MTNNNIQFSHFKHQEPIGKHFHLNGDDLKSNTNGVLKNANVEIITIPHIHSIIPILENASPYEHLTTGIPSISPVICVPKSKVTVDTISRDNDCLRPPNNGVVGLLVLDADNVSGSVRYQYIDAVPALGDYACVETSSSSSNIYNSNGEELRGYKGSHTFYAIKDPSDKKRTLNVIHKRLILARYDNHRIGKAGQFLERSPVDTMLCSSSQPIYMKPCLSGGLIQHKSITKFIGLPVIDTKKVISDLTEDEEKTYIALIQAAKFDLFGEMECAKRGWIKRQVDKGIPESQVRQALNHHILEDDYIVETSKGAMSVGELIANGEENNGLTLKDPIEPDYSGYTVAKFFWNNGDPIINSMAHGGITYRLRDTSTLGFGQAPLPACASLVPLVPVSESEIEAEAVSSYGYDVNTPICEHDWDPVHKTVKGNPLSTLKNFKQMMLQYGIYIGYDLISKKLIINGPGMIHGSDISDNANYAQVVNLCKLNRIETGIIDNYIYSLMIENEVNPVAEWIHSKPWDGVDRIDELFNTLTLESDQDRAIAYMFFRKWLIGAVKIVQNKVDRFEFVLVLQDAMGGTGKTAWFNKLTEPLWRKDGVLLDPKDKDSIKQAVSYWLVELGELDSIFKKADIKRLMSFLSNETDEIRLPYAKTFDKYKRRTAFMGTVNKREFLMDDSGDRRFWPISISAVNYEHDIDMQQLWAQVDTLEERHWLDSEENRIVINANEAFKAIDPIDELLGSYFNQPVLNEGEQHLNTTQILKNAEIDMPNKSQLNKAASWLRGHGYRCSIYNGIRGFYVPIVGFMR